MDVERPDLVRKRRRRRVFQVAIILGCVGLITVGLSSMGPVLPSVDREGLWIGEVKNGEMVRQVRGTGRLVPKQLRWVQAGQEGLIEKINVLPGERVRPESVLVELSNPKLEQALLEAQWELEAARAELAHIKVQLDRELLSQEVAAETVRAEWDYAEVEAQANEKLAEEGLVAELQARRYRLEANKLKYQTSKEEQRLELLRKSANSQIRAKEAGIRKLEAMAESRKRQIKQLKVCAGVTGVLQQLGDKETIQIGQQVGAGTTLAKIVQPTDLKAEVKISATEVREVQLGQKALVDTYNGIISGRVVRIDPAVQDGTVTVDVELLEELPSAARPDLRVDGIIELERLEDVLYVNRPVNSRNNAMMELFQLANENQVAVKVPVRLGRCSVHTVEIQQGLQVGERVILSDMSQWSGYNRIRLK